MEVTKATAHRMSRTHTDSFEREWARSTTDISTVVDISVEPVVILDRNFRVVSANAAFYQTFKLEKDTTEGFSLFTLCNEEWNIPSLRILLENIVENNTFFKGFEMTHGSSKRSRKVMLMSGRQIHSHGTAHASTPYIMLVMEDITGMIAIAERLARHTRHAM